MRHQPPLQPTAHDEALAIKHLTQVVAVLLRL
jgi:hypothetical protein